MNQSLFVVAKRPAAGQTKTRLCPPLDGLTAAALYECFLRDTLDVMREVPDVAREIVYLPESAADYFHALAPDMRLSPQQGANLGERLDRLLSAALANHNQRAVVIDSDSPTVPAAYLTQAFVALDGEADVVLGPCDDGGYYLIGLKRPQPRLLRDVAMSTPNVVRDTLALAEELGLKVALLPIWYDIDTVAELERLRAEVAALPASVARHTRAFLASNTLIGAKSAGQAQPFSQIPTSGPINITLIIPALNEEECIGPLLAELPPGLVQQLLVVDNGSTDDTAGAARRAGAHVVVEPRRGYGYACAAGVAAATGDVIAFMDGDGSFVPGELALLLAPIQSGAADMTLGTRLRGDMTAGAMPSHQRFGNRLVARLIRLLYGIELSDLGPFRAIRRDLLLPLNMRERTYGWPVEMIVKAARRHARLAELPVSYRPRLAGESKVGGTVRGTILATYRIFQVVLRYAGGTAMD